MTVPAAPPGTGRENLHDFTGRLEARFGHERNLSRQDDLLHILTTRMQATGSARYAQYVRLLAAADGREWHILAPLVTVPETYFFRMPDHFRALAEVALPDAIAANRRTRSLRILVAGCASGEEAYSIRILLRERFPQLAEWKLLILGVDLSEDALVKARAGLYSEWSLRATSTERRRANFVPAGAGDKRFRLTEASREGVLFRRENLLEAPPPAEPPFDLIFCRNVLIYFSEAAIRQTIARLTRQLVAGGYLFLGPAESLRGVSRNFHLCHTHDVFYYRRREHLHGEEPEVIPAAKHGRSRALAPSAPSALSAGSFDGTWYDSIQESSQRVNAMMRHGALKPDAPLAPASIRAPAVKREARSETFDSAGFFALVAAERFSEALALLEQPEAAAASEDHRILRASMLANLGRFAESGRECRLLLEADELNAGAHYLLGFALEQTGSLKEAREHMTKTTFLDPGFAMAHLHLGLLARQEGDRTAAESSLREALHALERDEAARLTLFGGGFSRETLRQICLGEMERLAGR